MKKIFFYLVVLALFSIGTAYGQFQVTSYFNPHPGETQTLKYGDTAAIFPGNGGANQTWNYATIINIGDSSVQTYTLPANTPYGSSFPTSTIASFSPVYQSGYTFFSGTSSVFELVGNQNSSYKTVYTDPQKFRIYPFSYQQSFVDPFSAVTYQGTNIVQKVSGNISVTYDGYGTLILPSGTVTNVGRFKFVSYEIDSMFFGPTPYVEYIKDTTWRWAKSNYRYGLFEIEKSWMSIDGINYSGYKWVGYIPNINSSIGINLISSEVPSEYKLEQNYPNPFNPSTNIRYQIPKNANVNIKIFDAMGREMITLCNGNQKAGIYEINWDASEYSSGVYYCRMISDGYIQTKQLVLVK